VSFFVTLTRLAVGLEAKKSSARRALRPVFCRFTKLLVSPCRMNLSHSTSATKLFVALYKKEFEKSKKFFRGCFHYYFPEHKTKKYSIAAKW
jgi:hypothetical protein